MPDLTIKINLDNKDAQGGVVELKEAFKSLSDEAGKTGEKTKSAAVNFSDCMKRRGKIA